MDLVQVNYHDTQIDVKREVADFLIDDVKAKNSSKRQDCRKLSFYAMQENFKNDILAT